MVDDLGKPALYAIQALVDGLRDAGILTEKAIAAIERRAEVQINYAAVLDSAYAAPRSPDEAAAIRHGIWWLRESIASTGQYLPGPISEHPTHFHDWPKLGKPWPSDE